MSITWNGVSSDTIGVIVERIPNRHVPTRRFSPQQVAGRNGNILLVDKSFPNVEQEYEVYLSAEAQGLPSVARACAEWLMGPDGYCRLEDSYDTTVYREAFLMGGYDLENILNKFGRCTITFSCKPQKYLLTGDTPIEIPAGITTYTGDVVQFDGVTGASITSLSTTITPTQDLHGYSSPWPGGGGENIYPASEISGTHNDVMVAQNGESYTLSGTASAYSQFVSSETFTLAAGTYTVKCFNQVNGIYVQLRSANGQTIYGNTSGGDNTFTLSASTTLKARIVVSNGTATNRTIQIEVVEGSTAPTVFTPYSNICPISGRTGLSVYVSPTTSQADATTYAVDWTDEAGTVYGGTLDVVTGVLTVTMVGTSVRGGFAAAGNGTFYKEAAFTSKAKNRQYGNFISSMWKTESGEATGGTASAILYPENLMFQNLDSNVRLLVYTTQFASVSDFNTALSTTPMDVCIELATPLTYQLTPQEIEVLVGENNVWTSSGPVSVTVEAPFVGTVTNPTPFEARPMLEVSGVGEITINGKTIQILESVSDFDIDCETMEAEDNSKIYCMDFPELSGGENEIVGDGSITALTVTPRWWTL